MRLFILGHIPSKKNLLKRSKHGGMFRDAKVSKKIDALTMQAKSQWIGKTPLNRPEMNVMFYVRDQRSDCDNKLTTILDCLHAAGVIVNDNIKHGPAPVTYDWLMAHDEAVAINLIERNHAKTDRD